jgi:hypothetical protein
MARSGRGTLTRSSYRPIPRQAFYSYILTASLAAAGISRKSLNQGRSGSIATAGGFSRQLTASKLLASSILPSSQIRKNINISKKGSITSSGFVNDIFVLALVLTGAVASIHGVTRTSPKKYLRGQLDTSSSIRRNTYRRITSALSMSGDIEQFAAIILNGSLVPQGTTANIAFIFRYLIGALTPSATARRRTSKQFSAAISSSGSIRKSIPRVLSGVIATTGALIKQRVGEINAISASITIDTIVNITMVYEDKSVILSIDGI